MECCFEHQEEDNNKREGRCAVASLESIKWSRSLEESLKTKLILRKCETPFSHSTTKSFTILSIF